MITKCTDLFTVALTKIFSSSPFSKYQAHDTVKYTVAKAISCVLISAIFISSCSTNAPVDSQQVTQPLVTNPAAEITLTAQQAIEQISELPTTNAGAQLLLANQLYLQDQDYVKALWLADKNLLLTDDDSLFTSQQKLQLMYIKASSLQALNYTELSYQQLLKLKSFAHTHQQALFLDYYLLLSHLLQIKSRPVEALAADLHAFSLKGQQDKKTKEQSVIKLWQQLQGLSQWQLAQLTKKQAPYSEGWLQLINYANKFASNATQFKRRLIQWRRSYPTHPATFISLQLTNKQIVASEIENIAILLPLSGTRQSVGLAAQQGILSAYNNDKNKTIHFFDTNKIAWNKLPEALAEHNVNYVIGPLQKANVEKYLTVSNSSPNAVTEQVTSTAQGDAQSHLSLPPTLLLNLPISSELLPHQIALSMNPEDEAIQAATTLSQENFKQPMILSHQDKVSKRIANAFGKQWRIMTDTDIDIVYLETGATMQDNLQRSLDVEASQARINELNSKLKQTIKTQTRNRRDIDMIYVIGSAEQTRLIKPFIDVNISPFAHTIPVYASSRSHSITNDDSSRRDLQGLTFTEMPWLLNSPQQNKALSLLSRQLWPKRSDNLSKIFAMGYDSYHIISKIPLMQQAPYIRHFGQTGVLKLNTNNILTRSLIWGRYQNDKVVPIAMD